MRRPKFRLALCAAGLAAALAGGALALGNGDSLISLSYLTDTFLPSAQSQLEEIQNDAMQEAYDQAAAQLQGCLLYTSHVPGLQREIYIPELHHRQGDGPVRGRPGRVFAPGDRG